MIFSFGRFSVQVLGNDASTVFFRNNWKKFLQSDEKRQIDVSLAFERVPLPESEDIEDGWSTEIHNSKKMAIYSLNREPVFAIQYDASQSIKVLIPEDENHNARLGAQYGLMTALNRECIGLHGVTLLCGDEVIILSAPSGTGKTTLAKLLERYCDAVVVNGDFALLNPTDNGVIYEPTPFCGTSGRALNHRFRVNRIVFLSQSKTNEWRELNAREALSWFMSNAFVPTWDNVLQQAVRENILSSLSMLKVNSYAFAPTQEAAEAFLRHLEEMN